MADTSRSLASILALLADNSAGNISPQDLRDAIVSVFANYAQIESRSGGTQSAPSFAGSPALVDIWDADGPASQITRDYTIGRLTVNVAGAYLLNFSATGDFAAGVTDPGGFRAFVNGTFVPGAETLFGTSNREAVGFSVILSLAASDYVEIFAGRISGATSSIAVDTALLSMHRIG